MSLFTNTPSNKIQQKAETATKLKSRLRRRFDSEKFHLESQLIKDLL